MRVERISIQNIGGIEKIDLNFNDKFNLICGVNGVGKTTILNAVAHCFNMHAGNPIIKVSAGHKDGIIKINIYDEIEPIEKKFAVSVFDASQTQGTSIYEMTGPVSPNHAKNFLYFRTDRTIRYVQLTSISNSAKADDMYLNMATIVGVTSEDIKNWFVNASVAPALDNKLSAAYLQNLQTAKDVFSWLDSNITFSRIDKRTHDIMVNTPHGEVYYEYLSSGYTACLHILLGIIKEIDIRFADSEILISEFFGVLLIDELDLHLHPQWQAVLISTLKRMLPNAQIIATSHSPSMLQVLSPEEIIALDIDDCQNVYKKQLELSEYGLQGWTIEEILKDIMGVPLTVSSLYEDTFKAYDLAMDTDNYAEALKLKDKLLKMLHPDSTIRKLIQIQTLGLEE